jgi:hypothetical protein
MSKELRERTCCRVLDWKVPRVECHSLENKPDIEKEKLGLSSNKFHLPVSTASLNAVCTSNSRGWSYIFSFHLKSSHNQIQSSVTPCFLPLVTTSFAFFLVKEKSFWSRENYLGHVAFSLTETT